MEIKISEVIRIRARGIKPTPEGFFMQLEVATSTEDKILINLTGKTEDAIRIFEVEDFEGR